MTAAEICIAARLQGVDGYGKYVHLLNCGMIVPPTMSEIRAAMPKKKRKYKPGEVRPVVQYDLKGEKIAEFADARSAALNMGKTSIQAIRAACTGVTNSAFGFQWRYEGDAPPGVYTRAPRQMPMTVTERVERVCTVCGKKYIGTRRSKVCSDECRKVVRSEHNRKYNEKRKCANGEAKKPKQTARHSGGSGAGA